MQTLILVDRENKPLGTVDRAQAHASPGLLHRAFSVYIFRNHGAEVLIQRRQPGKLWGDVWANSCCSHPRAGDDIDEVAHRRLREELGFSCPLIPVTSFVYQAEDPAGKGAEHEHVTVYRGDMNPSVVVAADPTEVAEWKWVPVTELTDDMELHPDSYAPWFHQGLDLLLNQKPVNRLTD